jgi:hypothetical protein
MNGTAEAIRLVEQWVEAVNAADIPGAVALSDADVELVGPRGASRGQKQLRDWVERAGLRMTTRRAFAREQRVVLLQDAEWRDPKGTPIAASVIASSFVVAGGRVVSVRRYDQLDAALRDARLDDRDEVACG